MEAKVNGRMILAILGIVLISQSVWGQTDTPSTGTDRTYINLPKKLVQAPFSDAVLVGNTLYISGRIGIDTATGKPYPELAKEITALLDGFRTTLAAAHMTMDDLVYVTVYCPDLTLYDQFNAGYRTYFKKDFPARAFIGSGPLLRGGHFEMQGIAVGRK
jgi:2-iminobutanoate/2-iminopropanoate deaminase